MLSSSLNTCQLIVIEAVRDCEVAMTYVLVEMVVRQIELTELHHGFLLYVRKY